MNSKKKRIFWLIGIGIIAWSAVTVLVYFSFKNFLGDVYVGRDCNYCKIDNIETRVQINIPKVNDSTECIYDAEEDSKTVYFSVITEKIDIDKYIEVNKLKHLDTLGQIDISYFLKLEKKPDINVENLDNYYYKTDENSAREFSIVLFDKSIGDLWVYLKYKDTIPAKHVNPSHHRGRHVANSGEKEVE